jgi:hypothetical protein
MIGVTRKFLEITNYDASNVIKSDIWHNVASFRAADSSPSTQDSRNRFASDVMTFLGWAYGFSPLVGLQVPLD